MRSLLLLPVLLVSSSLTGQEKNWAELPSSIDGDPLLPPMYRVVLGRSIIRFQAKVVAGRFASVRYLTKDNVTSTIGPWVLTHVIKKALVQGKPNMPMQVFQIRVSNMASNDEFPAGYSFWVSK